MLDKICEKTSNFFVNKNNRLVIITCFILSFISYFTYFTDELIIPDYLSEGFISKAAYYEMSLGRWLLPVISMIRNGVVAKVPIFFTLIVFIILSVIVLIKILKINNKLYIILMSAMFVLFPAIGDTLMFTYTADFYGLSLLLSILSVYFFNINYDKNKSKTILYNILGCILLICSLAIYQTFVNLAVTLCLIICIIELLKNGNTKTIIKKLLKNAMLVIISVLIYYLLTTLILKVASVEFSNYREASNLGIKSFSTYINDIKLAYINFYKLFFSNEFLFNYGYYREIFNGILFIIIILSIVIYSYENVNTKNFAIVILLFFLLPLAINILYVFIPNNQFHSLMVTPYLLVYVFILKILEITISNDNISKISAGLSVIVLIYIIYTYIISNSTTYLTKTRVFDTYYSFFTNIISRIDSLPDEHKNKKIVVIGDFENNSILTNYGNSPFVLSDLAWNYTGSYILDDDFCKAYLGYELNVCSQEEYWEIMKEYANYDTYYPYHDAITILDEYIIINMNEIMEE